MISLALRVHDMPAMIGFYGELLGITFEAAPFEGVEVMESRTGAFVLRFAALREEEDFDGFPVHQPGFAVDDVARAIRVAVAHGGEVEGEPIRSDGEIVLAALRDPDGNTLEVRLRR